MEVEKTPPVVDIGIVTIRPDEFRAVLDAFPEEATPKIYNGRREYTLRRAPVADGKSYSIAVVRQIEQGTGEAQNVARDLIEDLHPSLVLVVGIAGALPSHDISLGDVVLATKVLDYTVEALKFDEETTYSISGGPIGKEIASRVANLQGRVKELGDWAARWVRGHQSIGRNQDASMDRRSGERTFVRSSRRASPARRRTARSHSWTVPSPRAIDW